MAEKQRFSPAEALRLGKDIAQQRRNARLTQERLAEILKITTRHMQKIEAGGRVPSLHLLADLRRVLKISWEDLFKEV